MSPEYKKELIEKLKELSLSELLDLLLNEDKPETKKIIKGFIGDNFKENPGLELEKAMKNIELGNYPSEVKERLITAKKCAMEIKDNLEIECVNSITEINLLVSEITEKNTISSEP